MAQLNDQIASRAFAITPSDTTRISAAGLLIGGAGNIVVEPEKGGNTVTIAVTAGQLVPLRVVRVLVASTATGIIGLGG
jgi:hypothetical protein